MKWIVTSILLISIVSSAGLIPFADTEPIGDGEPTHLENEVMIESPYGDVSSATEITNSPTKYHIDISTNNSDKKTYYVAVDRAGPLDVSENASSMGLIVNGDHQEFEVTETLGKKWIGFTTSGEDISVEIIAEGTSGNPSGVLSVIMNQFFNSPMTLLMTSAILVLSIIFAYQHTIS